MEGYFLLPDFILVHQTDRLLYYSYALMCAWCVRRWHETSATAYYVLTCSRHQLAIDCNAFSGCDAIFDVPLQKKPWMVSRPKLQARGMNFTLVGHGSRSLANPLPSLLTAIVESFDGHQTFTPTHSCRHCTIDGRGYGFPSGRSPFPTKPVPI